MNTIEKVLADIKAERERLEQAERALKPLVGRPRRLRQRGDAIQDVLDLAK